MSTHDEIQPISAFIYMTRRLGGPERYDYSKLPSFRCAYSLCLVQSGSVQVAIADKEFSLGSNMAALIAPGPHISFAPNSRVCHLTFDLEHRDRELRDKHYIITEDQQAQPPWERFFPIPHEPILDDKETRSLAELFDVVMGRYWLDPLQHADSNARLQQWLVHFVQTRSQDQSPSLDKELANKAQQIMHHNPYLNVEDIAKRLAVTRFHLNRCYKALFNRTLRETLLNLRIERAKDFLTNSDNHSIQEIAYATGYSSVQSFSRSFKNVTGLSPKQWRLEYSPD